MWPSSIFPNKLEWCLCIILSLCISFLDCHHHHPHNNNNNNQPYLVMLTLNSKANKPVALIPRSNRNLECWFLWRKENSRTQRKTLGAGTRTNNKLNSHMRPASGNWVWTTLVGGECSHHCAIAASALYTYYPTIYSVSVGE